MNQRNMIEPARRISSIIVTLVLVFSFLSVPARFNSPETYASYIVQAGDVETAARIVKAYDGKVTSHLPVINGVAARLPVSSIASLQRQQAIRSVTHNSSVFAAANPGGNGPKAPPTDYADGVGADLVWENGVIGSGITVAVVDTGLSWHKGVVMNVDGRLEDRILGWVDFIDGKRTPTDPNGHGTHVAGIIANSQIGEDSEWNGVAPGVSLVGVRVLDENGNGTYEQVIQGIQWVIENKDVFNIRVMNMSLVSMAQSPYWADPLNQAVMKAWASGITVVVAAANTGPDPMTIGVPGNNPYVVTVGAFTDNYTPYNWSDDYITSFSAAGPTLDSFVKPDVVAPGAHMVSAMMPNSSLSKNHQANQLTNQYFSMAGTSQASAVVSGIAALILSQNPTLTPDQVKYRIMITSLAWIDIETLNALYSIWQQGAGRVNAPDAVFSEISGEANGGMDIWADLAGSEHYEGFSFYDEATGQFRLRDDFYSWDGGYGAWSGGYGAWSGGYGAWSGGYGAWSGGYGAWSGGYGAWSGGYGAWSGSEPWAGSIIADDDFLADYIIGISPDTSAALLSVSDWVEEP